MSLVTLTLEKADSTPAVDGRYFFDGVAEGFVDAAGFAWEDVPSGSYMLALRAGGRTAVLPVYVPTLEGPFTVGALKTRRPDKAVVLYGAPGTFHGLEALTTLTGSSASQKTEQTFATTAVDGWAFEPGKSAGWSEWADGKLWMAGQDQKLGELNPASTECVVSYFDPGTQVLKHFVIPTTAAIRNAIGSNGVTGGAPGADVCAVRVGSEIYLVGLSSVPYQGWPISTFGLFPTLPVFRKVGGAWAIDAGKSRTTDDLHNASANGATAFPWTTNSFGEQYGNTLGLSELDATPGGHLISAEYFQDPAVATRGGRMVAIDPATGIVLAYYTVPFTAGTGGVQTLSPRAVVCDPTGTSGHYRFGVIFDCYDINGLSPGFNVLQLYELDEVGGTITPLTNWLTCGTALGADTNWTNWVWDDDGWLWIGRRTGTPVAPLAVFPKVDGSIALLGYPYAPFDGTFAQVLQPDFSVTIPTAQASQTWGRMRYDAALATAFHVSGNQRITAIAKAGDAHAPVLTMLPIVNPEINDYILPAISGLLFPSDASIDHVARALYVPLAQTFKNSDPYPQAPQVKDQWLLALDIDRIAAQPCFVGSTHVAQLSKTSITPALPTFWQAGDLVVAFMTNGLTSDPATNPVTVSAGWTKPVDVRNGGAGLRYVIAYRVMQAGDAAPTFSWTGSQNPTCMVIAYRGADSTTPLDTIVQNIGGAGAASFTTLLTRLSITPSVAGSRIVGIYAIQGQQDATLGQGEVTPGEIVRADQVGNGLGGGISSIVTEEEQLATANPTRSRGILYTTAALEAAFTLAIRPAPTPANPPAVSTVACVPNPVAHGSTTVCMVTLASAAPPQGCVATVTASNSKATAPYTCFIAPGATSGTVTVNAITAGTVTITAKTVGSSVGTVLTIS